MSGENASFAQVWIAAGRFGMGNLLLLVMLAVQPGGFRIDPQLICVNVRAMLPFKTVRIPVERRS